MFLLEAAADVNKQDKYGDTALMNTARYGRHECIDALLHADVDVNKQNETVFRRKTAVYIQTP